jgi:hypothetical protein
MKEKEHSWERVVELMEDEKAGGEVRFSACNGVAAAESGERPLPLITFYFR